MSYLMHRSHEGLYILFVHRFGVDFIVRLVLIDWLVTIQKCYSLLTYFRVFRYTSYHTVPSAIWEILYEFHFLQTYFKSL